MTTTDQLRTDLARANHILYQHRIVDAFGHISARSETDQERFYLSRNMAPAQVTAEDILEFDLDGGVIGDQTASPYLERFIHGAIYRARPDVMAIVHSHAHSLIPFGVTSCALKPLWHMAAFLKKESPVFEIRDFAGEDSNLLITSNDLGDALAGVLGNASVVLMRGHGATIVGKTIPQAVYRAIYTKANAEIQSTAAQMGEIRGLNEAEAESADKANDGQIKRAWDLWCREEAAEWEA